MAYITKRGSSYGVRYTYQDEQGKNCNKWESFSTKEVIYALSDFLIMILSWLVKQSLRAFLFQEVQP